MRTPAEAAASCTWTTDDSSSRKGDQKQRVPSELARRLHLQHERGAAARRVETRVRAVGEQPAFEIDGDGRRVADQVALESPSETEHDPRAATAAGGEPLAGPTHDRALERALVHVQQPSTRGEPGEVAREPAPGRVEQRRNRRMLGVFRLQCLLQVVEQEERAVEPDRGPAGGVHRFTEGRGTALLERPTKHARLVTRPRQTGEQEIAVEPAGQHLGEQRPPCRDSIARSRGERFDQRPAAEEIVGQRRGELRIAQLESQFGRLHPAPDQRCERRAARGCGQQATLRPRSSPGWRARLGARHPCEPGRNPDLVATRNQDACRRTHVLFVGGVAAVQPSLLQRPGDERIALRVEIAATVERRSQRGRGDRSHPRRHARHLDPISEPPELLLPADRLVALPEDDQVWDVPNRTVRAAVGAGVFEHVRADDHPRLTTGELAAQLAQARGAGEVHGRTDR